MKSYRQVLQSFVPQGQRLSARALIQSHGLSFPSSLSALIQKLEEPPPPPLPLPVDLPMISVSSEGVGGNSIFTVTGSGFLSNSLVTIRAADDALNLLSFQQSATGDGHLNFRKAIPCVSGIRIHFSATDGRLNSDHTGELWSNTFTTTCP